MTEQGTQPPEQVEREPTRHDDIDFDTVGCWRDDVTKIRKLAYAAEGTNGVQIYKKLNKLFVSMNKALDDAQGFNDPEPEPPVDEDKMKARQHGG